MTFANSFDMWQKDSFFAAAEEVQQSADVMESAYRIFLKHKITGYSFDQLCRDLQISLGTAKWQLEEFERAVKLSYGHRLRDEDDAAPARHAQFITAIQSQIFRVEEALRDALYEQGKQQFRWVNLDKQENDDLALFLSGTTAPEESVYDSNSSGDGGTRGCHEGVTSSTTEDSDADCVIHVQESSGRRDGVICQLDATSGNRGSCGSTNFGALRIVVCDEDEQVRNSSRITEDTPKDKEMKLFFGRQRNGRYSLGSGSLFNKVLGRNHVFERQKKGPLQLKFVHSVRLTLVLMLSIFLIVPFLLYLS